MLSKKYNDFLKWNVYQIYPKSFCDGNSDGIGDLAGIISKLDYLKELGINAIWICPCYKTENYDNGYDITDYRQINPDFGAMEDMDRLISEMHRRDMKLIMDLVPNHTSSEHEWFRQSRMSKNNRYSNFYYWADEPLNDWESCFLGSAWQYDEPRGQYYLHSYAVGQPDLNWEEPRVVKEIQNVIDFWVDKGVDGFRCDVIDQISKDFVKGTNCMGPRLHEFIHDMFGRKKTENIFTVGECWVGDVEEFKKHSAVERGELSTLFQFDHFQCGQKNKFEPRPDTLQHLARVLTHWEILTADNDLLYPLFTDNHDTNRFISRIGNDTTLRYESATCIATMVYLLKGIPFVYQGQEFGMTGSHHKSIDEFVDIESLNKYKALRQTLSDSEAMEQINFGSRDNPRRPMCWNGEKKGGFCECEPWLPAHSRYKEINLEADRASDKSVFEFYKKLLHFRVENDCALYGDFELLSGESENYFAYTRSYDGKKFAVICNYANKSEINIDCEIGDIILKNYADRCGTEAVFRPYEVLVAWVK